MPERDLDASWLQAWCQRVAQGVSRLMATFEETHGYPAGDNEVALADDERGPRSLTWRSTGRHVWPCCRSTP
jgi:hypothetical protein